MPSKKNTKSKTSHSIVEQWRTTPVDPARAPSKTALSPSEWAMNGGMSSDRLVDLKKFGLMVGSTDPNVDADEALEIKLRETPARQLQTLDKTLRVDGYALLIRDGYRTLKEQRRLWNDIISGLKKKHLALSHEKIRSMAEAYCRRPDHVDTDKLETVPVHTTGGAVDLTLIDLKSGEPLVMSHPEPMPDRRDRTNHCETIDIEDRDQWTASARPNRRLLFNAMLDHGFINYPEEWWHYEWGTLRWKEAHHLSENELYHPIT